MRPVSRKAQGATPWQPRMERIGERLCVRTMYTGQRAEMSLEQAQTLDRKLLRAVSSSMDLKRISELLREGADPNAREGSINFTALMIAARRGKAHFADLLLDFGADSCLRGHGNATAYEIAKTWGQEEVISLFRRRGLAHIPK